MPWAETKLLRLTFLGEMVLVSATLATFFTHRLEYLVLSALMAPGMRLTFIRRQALSFLDEADEEQENDGPDDGRDQRADQPTGGQSQDAEQESADQCTDDTNDDITEQAETPPLHDQAGEPTRHGTDDQEHDQTLNIHGEVLLSRLNH